MDWQDICKARLPALLERTDEPDRLEGLIARLEACVAEGGLSVSEADLALSQLAGAPEPCQTLLYLLQLCDSDEGPEVLGEEGALETFLILAGQGDYPARIVLRRPEDLSYLTGARLNQLARGVDSLKGELHGRIEADVNSGADREAATFAQLRRLKRRESLRIYLREIENLSSVRQTTAEIAAVAEACLDVACTQGAQVLGEPELADEFCILGMGKLGGRELNFSSDVDLIYICSDQAARDADTKELVDALGRWVTRAMGHVSAEGYVFRVDLRLRPEGSRGALVHSLEAMNDYYLNWGRTWERSAMLKARPVAGRRELGEQLLESLEPFMYRRYLDFEVIDELRSMKEQIDRNAHVSAVVGLDDEEVQEPAEPAEPTSSLKARLRRKMKRAGAGKRSRSGRSTRLRSGAFSSVETPPGKVADKPDEDESLGEELSASRLDRTGSPFGWDVKIGVGGIREIEFFVQALQLIHCGMRPALRVRRTLDALDRLLYSGLITHEDHAALADAYDLFRRVEHRVQMEHDRQAHRLPADRAGFERLARRMFRQPDRLEDELTGHRKAVAGMFERLFTESAQTPDEPTVRESQPSELATVLGVSADRLSDAAVIDAIRSLGFRRPRQVAGQIQMLREKTYGPFGRHAGTRHSQLSRFVLQACASAPNPDQAFSYWSRLSTVVGDRPGVFDMLFENPHATRLLLHVFGSSNFLASIVMREPNVIDYLLGSDTVAIVREHDEMSRELGRRLSGITDPSHRLGRVRRFHQEEVLRIALHEVAGTVDIGQTVRQLSMLAEVVLEAVLAEVYEALVDGMGKGADKSAFPDFDELPFVVLGMGKLGGRELAFGSDLDVIFVYEDRPDAGLDHPFFARLAQRLVRNLTSVSAHGKLYEVDTRLRPSGRQGTLVVSLDAFRDYHRERADLWERQAMIRARPLSGNRKLRAKLMELREQFAFEAPAPEDLAPQMRQMRDKIAESLGGDGRGVDIKTHPGGMVDVEFLTQYLQIAHAADLHAAGVGARRMNTAERLGEQCVDGPRSQNTMRALARLAQADDAGRVDLGVDCVQLLEDYRTLRRVEARLRMSEQRPTSRLPDDDEELSVLARRLGYQGAGARQQLEAELDTLLERVQGIFESVMRPL